MNKNILLKDMLKDGSDFFEKYKDQFVPYTPSDISKVNGQGKKIIAELHKRLMKSYPFFHPYYAGQMLKPPHPVALAAYISAMMINPNNHALDGGPETSRLEKECIAELAKLFGFKEYLGHLTSGGTIANLEALWIAKKLNPSGSFAISENAHYTHTRLAGVLNYKYELVKMAQYGRMDINYLEKILKKKNIGTVVATLGTTGFGALDEIHEIVKLKSKYGFRLHIDAAYGGFYKVLANLNYKEIDKKPFEVVPYADSIVLDPHKHGLQPYGCGSVLFRDPEVGRFYKHDSPYTYFTSDELHLGEVTIECSRAGASAAAFWATLKLFPLNKKNGLYKILKECREAALKFESLAEKSDRIKLLIKPELDIVNYFYNEKTTGKISEKNKHVFNKLMNRKEKPIYLSLNKVKSDFIKKTYPDIIIDSEETVILRSVLMKPEQKGLIGDIITDLNKF